MKKILILLALPFLWAACAGHSPAAEEATAPVVNQVKILEHPRLLFPASAQKQVEKRVKQDPLYKALYQLIRNRAQELLAAPQIGDEAVSLHFSREYLNRMLVLGLVYRLSGEEAYAQKVEASLRHLCSYADWHPAHYLDVAELTEAVAIGYDWCYPALSQETRDLVVRSIKTKALDLVVKEYATGNDESWAKRNTNWNVVCNAGMTLGALAVAEDYPALCGEIILNAVKYLPNCLNHLGPHGVCYEGPAYWEYTMANLSLFLKAVGDNLGTHYGISDIPGVKETATYYVRTLSPTNKCFNFADATGTAASASFAFGYYATAFDQPQVGRWYRQRLQEVADSGKLPAWHIPLALVMAPGEASGQDSGNDRARVWRGINDIVVLSGPWDTPGSLHMLAKGADPDMAHQQMDGGTFLVETQGVRWTEDIGCDSYDIPGFWEYQPGGRRWDYLRNSNLGHNTLNIDGHLTHSRGTAHVLHDGTAEAQPYVSLDMSSLYPQDAQSVLRTYTLADDFTLVLRDEALLNNPASVLYWRAYTLTQARVEGRWAHLSHQGKEFHLYIVAPEDAVFTAAPARPHTQYEKSMEGITCLEIAAPAGQAARCIEVRMSADPSRCTP